MALKVIGAGFGRTGTTSLKAALEQLGFSKCHHMQEVARSRKQVDAWLTRTDGGTVDWNAVFEGFEACCDWPSVHYWEELSRHYPDAKIILSVRDEERWYDSVAQTIYPASHLLPRWLETLIPPIRRINKIAIAVAWEGTFHGRFEDRDHALKIYRDHIEYVKAAVPPERLLVFEAKQGWEPLCRFLNVPVPETEYPHLNDAAKIRRLISGTKALGWLSLAAIGGGLLTLAMGWI
jgi:hypothetical protein